MTGDRTFDMTEHPHIIHRQIVDLTLKDPGHVYELQNRASEYVREQVYPYLDSLLSELCPLDRHIILDSLELDLESVQAGELAEKLSPGRKIQIRQAIEDQLRYDRKTGSTAEFREGVSRTPDDHLAALLRYFLAHGTLPWWAGKATLPEMESQLISGIRADPDTWRPKLRDLLTDSDRRLRAISQLRDPTLVEIAGLFSGVDTESIVNSLQNIATETGLAGSAPEEMRSKLWKAIVPRLLSPAASADPSILIRAGATALFKGTDPDLPSVFQSISDRLESLSIDDNAVVDFFSKESQIITSDMEKKNDVSGTSKQAVRVQDLISQLITLWKDDPMSTLNETGVRRLLYDALQRKLSESGRGEDLSVQDLEGALSALAQAEQIPYRMMLQALARNITEHLSNEPLLGALFKSYSSPSSEIDQSGADQRQTGQEEQEKIAVRNAGIVILWPFLQSFFAALDLYESSGFRSGEAQETAVLLLHYIATGETDVPEHDLILAKILCNWQEHGSLSRDLQVSELMRRETDSLLNSVISNWSALKNTSPGGLRNTYLQRPGLLTSGDDRSVLQVERNAFDVLLEKLPWTISVIKLPWMPRRIEVEW